AGAGHGARPAPDDPLPAQRDGREAAGADHVEAARLGRLRRSGPALRPPPPATDLRTPGATTEVACRWIVPDVLVGLSTEDPTKTSGTIPPERHNVGGWTGSRRRSRPSRGRGSWRAGSGGGPRTAGRTRTGQ